MGFVDGLGTSYSYPMGDRRFLLCTGPVTMAPGDTQEVVGAFLIAQGGDRLKSVTLLKSYDVIAQSAFNHNFVVFVNNV